MDDSNGRVTLAILGQQIQTVLTTLADIRIQQEKLLACYQDMRDRLTMEEGRLTNEVTRAGGVHEKLWAAIDDTRDDVKALKGRDAWGTALVGLATVLAGAIAWLKP